MKKLVFILPVILFASCSGDKSDAVNEPLNAGNSTQPKVEEPVDTASIPSEKTEPTQTTTGEISLDPMGSGCYESERVKKMMTQKLQSYYEEQNDEYFDPFYFIELNNNDLLNLTDLEKFVYATEYPAEISQVCASMMGAKDPQKQVVKEFKFEGAEAYFSKSQDSLLMAMNNESIRLIKGCFGEFETLSNRYKEIFLLLESYKLIPSITKMYKQQEQGKKDNELLGLLIVKMEKDQYPAYLESGLNEKFEKVGEYYPQALSLTPQIIEQIFELSRSYMLWKSLEA